MSKSTAVILINLGTPQSVELKDVRRFLGEFLMDRYVIQIPWLFRFLLVYGLILPTRSTKTQEAYQTIWDTQNGSPLLYNSKKLLAKLSEYFEKIYPEQYVVQLAMRYAGGDLSLKTILNNLQNKNIEKLIVLPLYPQYAVSTTLSSIEAIEKEASKKGFKNIEIIKDFYEHPGFIEAQAAIISKVLNSKKIDYLLFSFHGLPQQHVKDTGCQNCTHDTICSSITERNRWCYRAQCFATTRALVKILGLDAKQYGVSFQSRLGRLPWIGPYTEEKIKALAQQGVKHLAVVCPAFVADCLETQEEIKIRLKTSWFTLVNKKEQANTSFSFIPCVNDHSQWVAGIGQIIHNQSNQ